MSDAASLSGIRVDQKPSELECIYRKSPSEELGFTFPEFRQLIESVCGQGELTKFLDSLRLGDLLLARACARGHERSWERFLALYREKLYAAALSMTRNETGARELADSLYADLFGTRTQHDGKRVSRLESYLGRGSLEGWLRTVLAQQYVNRFRTERKLISFDEATEISDQREFDSTYTDAEQAHLARATDSALESSSSEDRFLLAAYYLDGRTLAAIGRMLHIHESSVSRRLEKITAGLRKRILNDLCRHGFARSAADEMLKVDVRDVSGSLGALVRNRLAQEREPESFPK